MKRIYSFGFNTTGYAQIVICQQENIDEILKSNPDFEIILDTTDKYCGDMAKHFNNLCIIGQPYKDKDLTEALQGRKLKINNTIIKNY